MSQLNRTNTGLTRKLPLKIMQFGGGNFLRAFVDWMIHVLNERTNFNAGVAIIKPTEYGDYHDLKAQEGLFTVVLDGLKNGKFTEERTLVSVVQQVVNCYQEWMAYLELAKTEELRFIISNTTEAGIRFDPEDQFSDDPPKEFPAKLTIWLYHRFKHFNGDMSKGCIFLPCELIEDNGEALKTTILQYTRHWELPETFINWIQNANYFCSTLVDRIVSGYPKDRAVTIQNHLGYKDALLVAGEYYHSWVIDAPDNVKEELPFANTDLNVSFVEDLGPYREMKVRILNGAHTAMVPVGYLADKSLVKEGMDTPFLVQYIEELLQEEVAKTLNFPDQVKQRFANDVLDRFRNPILKHQLISIALNSTSKFVSRLLPSLRDFVEAEGRLARRIVFSLSALIVFYKGNFNGKQIALNDDEEVVQFFKESWNDHSSGNTTLEEMTTKILRNSAIWSEDLTLYPDLLTQVVHNIQNIEKFGIEKSLELLHKGNITV
ncbi:MAG: tagaturonate reductase [Flavobacteriaceae bacterium]